MADERQSAIVTARLKRMARWKARMAQTASVADERPQGSGPANRHGMPKVPIGQTESKTWPVLDLGVLPEVTHATWQLTIDGAVAKAIVLDYQQLLALPQVLDAQDFHCVTQWSRMDLQFRGVQARVVLALAELADAATHVLCHGYDGYTTNLPLEEILKDDVLLAFEVDGLPLPHEHGGPVRLVTPQLYAWKGAKWLSRLEVLVGDRKGYWEERGYSNTAYPWRNDRYG